MKSRDAFQRVFKKGKVAADGTLVIHAIRADRTQIGLSLSRKVGNAPTRNRWKRLIREVYRRAQHELPGDLLFVVRPKKGAQPDFDAIRASLPALLKRLDRQLR